MVIKRVSPMSAAKIAGVLYAIMGLAFGAIISLFAMLGSAFGGGQIGTPEFFPMLFGVGSVILFPIFYGCMGFVMTAIMAWLYNLVAGMVGGVQIDAQ